VGAREFSEKVPSGNVISSDPDGGSGATTGSTVTLIVSLGPERYEVPRVRGQSPAEAAATLSATNLAVAGEKQTYHDRIPTGTVVGTDPTRGTEVKRDAGITLLVSKVWRRRCAVTSGTGQTSGTALADADSSTRHHPRIGDRRQGCGPTSP
jgi:serine/threonine-protein kinase